MSQIVTNTAVTMMGIRNCEMLKMRQYRARMETLTKKRMRV
jgi:hypothetical protein